MKRVWMSLLVALISSNAYAKLLGADAVNAFIKENQSYVAAQRPGESKRDFDARLKSLQRYFEVEQSSQRGRGPDFEYDPLTGRLSFFLRTWSVDADSLPVVAPPGNYAVLLVDQEIEEHVVPTRASNGKVEQRRVSFTVSRGLVLFNCDLFFRSKPLASVEMEAPAAAVESLVNRTYWVIAGVTAPEVSAFESKRRGARLALEARNFDKIMRLLPAFAFKAKLHDSQSGEVLGSVDLCERK